MRNDDTNSLCSIPSLLRKADAMRRQPKRTWLQRFLAWFADVEAPLIPVKNPESAEIGTCSNCGDMFFHRPVGSFVPNSDKCYPCETGLVRPRIPTKREVEQMRAGEPDSPVVGKITRIDRQRRLKGER